MIEARSKGGTSVPRSVGEVHDVREKVARALYLKARTGSHWARRSLLAALQCCHLAVGGDDLVDESVLGTFNSFTGLGTTFHF